MLAFKDFGQLYIELLAQARFFFFFFLLFRAAPAACGGSQARGRIGAIAHQPTPQQRRILNPLSEARDPTATS